LGLLHIDAEVYDLEVLGPIDIKKHRPNSLMFEHKQLAKKPKQEFVKMLEDEGYIIHFFFDDIVAETT
jgi:hypothetical protein